MFNSTFTSYLQSNYSTVQYDNKNHQNGLGEHDLTFGSVKIRFLGHTPEFFFTEAPHSLEGPHFPYIIMAIEGGNSTGAT